MGIRTSWCLGCLCSGYTEMFLRLSDVGVLRLVARCGLGRDLGMEGYFSGEDVGDFGDVVIREVVRGVGVKLGMGSVGGVRVRG